MQVCGKKVGVGLTLQGLLESRERERGIPRCRFFPLQLLTIKNCSQEERHFLVCRIDGLHAFCLRKTADKLV